MICWLNKHPTGASISKLRRFEVVYPGSVFTMLHTFSHLLLTAISLECGYPASSIRERVYAIDGLGYGVLLFTGSSDAEGTLGGLIEAGRRIHTLVESALEMGRLCSNDPVCAQRSPQNVHEHRFLQGGLPLLCSDFRN